MILQPIFPPSFPQLIKTIVNKQLAVYRAKQKINHRNATALFDTIDYLKTGQIYLEDLYSYLKTKGLNISKRQLKFINRYFGFPNNQKLSLLLFKKNFLFDQQQNEQTNQDRQDHQELFVNLVRLAVQSYNEIEKLRSMVSLNINQLEECFQLFYPDSPKSITKPILQQLLAIFGIYSRLNLQLLTKYMIGDQANEVSIRQLFWNSNIVQKDSKNKVESKTKCKKQIHTQTTEQIYSYKNTPKNNKNLDILIQIQNIQASIRSKYDRNTSQKQQEQVCSIKKNKDKQRIDFKFRNSEINETSCFAKQPIRVNRPSNFKKTEASQVSTNKKQRDDLEVILKRSLESFEEKDPIYEREAQIQQLLKNRVKNKTKEEVMSRASSAAKLKIQEIENRVFSKNKGLTSGISHTALRTPTNLMVNYSSSSKNTSIKKR